MRSRFVIGLVAATALAGCGGAASPPDETTSRQLIATTVTQWQRLWAAGDGASACAYLTDAQQRLFATAGHAASCVQAVDRSALVGDPTLREAAENTVVDAVAFDGTRATATVHTVLPFRGGLRQTPPADLTLEWSAGRWLLSPPRD